MTDPLDGPLPDGLAAPVVAQIERGRAGRRTPFDPAKLPAFRPRYSAGFRDRDVAPGVTVQDIEVDTVPVRLYRPSKPGPLPLHVYYHGGGFIVGSALSGELDGTLSRRAAASESIVASVDYALAPEHPFPEGVEDSYRALTGLVARADEFGVETRAVSVGGASSGGNFAAVVALMARDRGGPALILQLLEIAGTDLTKSSHAWRHPRPEHDTTRERDSALLELYVPRLQDRAHPYASPLFAPDLSGLPPAYVMNAEFDPRRDECEAYVTRLQDAGVPAVARCLAGHVHGSLWIMDWEPAAAWQQEADAILARANRAAFLGQPLRSFA